MDSHSNLSSFHSVSKSLFQEEVCQNYISEAAYIETLDSKPTFNIEFQKSNWVVNDTLQRKL